MEIILCDENNLNDLIEFYNKETLYLEKNINYPLWIHGIYPSKYTIKPAVDKKHQYAYLENGNILVITFFLDDGIVFIDDISNSLINVNPSVLGIGVALKNIASTFLCLLIKANL